MHSKAGAGILDRLSGSIHNLTGNSPRHGHLYPEFEVVRTYVNNLAQKLSSLLTISTRINKERTGLYLFCICIIIYYLLVPA